MEFHMHIQWLKKEEDYPQHFRILWFVSTKADEIPSRIHKRRGEGKAEGGRG